MTDTPSQDSVVDSSAVEPALLRDENAFGILVSWFDAEEVEYAQSSDKFPPRVIVLRTAVADYLSTFPLGEGVVALDFGTQFYVEIADGDQTEDILGWVKSLRAFLAQGDWVTFAAVTYGGRWVGESPVATPATGKVRLLASHGPSEALRRAFAADSLSHDDEETGDEGWGAGLFVDVEALEALGRKLKNQPTTVRAAGASFVRVSG